MEILIRYALPAIAILLFVFVDWFSVKWFETGNFLYAPLIAVLATAAYWIFGWVSNHTSLSVTSGLINTGIVVGTILVGIFVRKDVLDAQQKIGLITAISSVALLTIHR